MRIVIVPPQDQGSYVVQGQSRTDYRLRIQSASCVGRDSSVGTANRYRLDGSEDRLPMETRFSAPV